MTVPLLSFIDSSTRKLSHGIAEMCGINSRDKFATVKVKMLQTNVLTGKEYPKYLRYKKNSKTYVSKKLKFKLPSKKLMEDYERIKKAFTTQLNKEIMNKLLKVEEKDLQTRKPLSPMQEKVTNLLRNNGVEKVAELLGYNIGTVYEHKRSAEKKGVVFKPLWEDKRIIGHNIEGYGENTPQSEGEAQSKPKLAGGENGE